MKGSFVRHVPAMIAIYGGAWRRYTTPFRWCLPRRLLWNQAGQIIKSDVVVVGAGPAGLAAAHGALESGSSSVVVLEAGPALRERSRDRPSDSVSGCGGAGAWSDGKFSFFPSATELWNLSQSGILRRSYGWVAGVLRTYADDASAVPDFPEAALKPTKCLASSTAPDAANIGSWKLKRYPSIYIGQEGREAMVQRLCDEIGPTGPLSQQGVQQLREHLRTVESAASRRSGDQPSDPLALPVSAAPHGWIFTGAWAGTPRRCLDGGRGWEVPVRPVLDSSAERIDSEGVTTASRSASGCGGGASYALEPLVTLRCNRVILAGGRCWPMQSDSVQDIARGPSPGAGTAMLRGEAAKGTGSPLQARARDVADGDHDLDGSPSGLRLRSYFRRLEYGARVVGPPSAPLFAALESHQLDPKLVLRRRVRLLAGGVVELAGDSGGHGGGSDAGAGASAGADPAARVLHEGWVEWRTFCFCRAGDVVEADVGGGSLLLSGRGDLSEEGSLRAAEELRAKFEPVVGGQETVSTGVSAGGGVLHNMGFNVRVLDHSMARAVAHDMRMFHGSSSHEHRAVYARSPFDPRIEEEYGGHGAGLLRLGLALLEEAGAGGGTVGGLMRWEGQEEAGGSLVGASAKEVGGEDGGAAGAEGGHESEGNLLGLALPTLEGVGWYPDLDGRERGSLWCMEEMTYVGAGPGGSRGSEGDDGRQAKGQPEGGPDLLVAGDAAGAFRGIVAAMVSGYYAGVQAGGGGAEH